ncbi:MAG: hypothetical protein MUC59_05210 [Saprospiraceae bacterium]|jgi:hypothetical protein|nr:hypothetical protein [Saprospiraceae bacterium]
MYKTNFSTSLKPFFRCFFCFAICSCGVPEQPNTIAPAFYHWQTELRLTKAERDYLNALKLKKLYVKFFDVDWDAASNQPVPLAPLVRDTAQLGGLDIVPCVFITNRTLLQLPMLEVDSLASRIFQKIMALSPSPPQEIQLDCDWTPQTQAKYFALLTQFKQLQEMAQHPPSTVGSRKPILSATIRLHQYKYPEKTGVPPVDRGMLMCYNTGDVEDWGTENAILDLKTLESYLPPNAKADYPLPLDLALPAFRWGVLFRDGQMIKLLNNLGEPDLSDPARFKKTAQNRYEVVKSTYVSAHYLYAGDLLRLEATSPEELKLAATLLNKVKFGPAATVAFYHLDTTATQLFPKEKMEEVLRQF